MKHSEVRQSIIQTASDLFYKNGYNLTGINEIISEAGIAKATLYNHFKSKDDICVAYLQHKNGAFLEELDKYCTKQPSGWTQIVSIFDFLLAFFKRKDFNGCWCINTISEVPKENELVGNEIRVQKEKFMHLIKRLVESNSPNTNKNKVDQLSKQIYLLYEGAVAESHLHQEEWPIESARLLCERLVD